MSARRCPTFVCAAVFAARVVSGSDGDPGSEPARGTAITTPGAARGPTLDPRLSERVAARVEEGISVARERLRTHPSCQALFARLGAEGEAKLDGASYHPASAEQERRYCRRGVFALTTVGGSAVALCRSFGHLSGPRAAIILIHEALHLAGQAERKVDAEAPDSLMITRTVMGGCWLF